MKIKDYDDAMAYVEQHCDVMLGFICAETPAGDTPEALFERLAQWAQKSGQTPDEQLWYIWNPSYKERYEKAHEIAGTLHQFFYGEATA